MMACAYLVHTGVVLSVAGSSMAPREEGRALHVRVARRTTAVSEGYSGVLPVPGADAAPRARSQRAPCASARATRA